MVSRKTVMVVLAAAVLVGARQSNETLSAQQKSQWEGVYSEAQAKRGEALYVRSCATCHGTDLKGGERAPALAGPAFSGRWVERPLGAPMVSSEGACAAYYHYGRYRVAQA